MAEPLTVGKLVHARMFGHTVETEILEKRIVERGRVEVRLKVPTEIVKEIRREARPVLTHGKLRKRSGFAKAIYFEQANSTT